MLSIPKEQQPFTLLGTEANMDLPSCSPLFENGTMNSDTYGPVRELAGDAFKLIAEKAKMEKNWQWKPPNMVPVLNKDGTPIWVKGEFQKNYRV